MLDVDLKNTWINVLESNWFYYNQAGISVIKVWNLLELSVEHLVIQSRLTTSMSLSQAMFGVWKTKCYMLFAAKFAIFVSIKIYPSLSLILFCLKGNNKPKSLSKSLVQVISCQLFQEMCIKSKDIDSSRLFFQKNGMI